MASDVPQPRTYIGALTDRLFGISLGLPAPLCAYITTSLTIPLPSSISLAATLYQPTLPQPHGLLLTLTPYPRTGLQSIPAATVWAARGYLVLLISCRGTQGSTGALDPSRTEREDFAGVLSWLQRQSWYPGRFATFGASYAAFTQYALLSGGKKVHNEHVGMVAPVGLHDFAWHHWGNGAFRLDRIAWADLIINQEDANLGFVTRTRRMVTAAKGLQPVYESLPVVDGVKRHFGDKDVGWLLQSMSESDIGAPYWAGARHDAALKKINVPVFLQTGWWDQFFYQTIEQYRCFRERGIDVQLVVGPWTHMQVTGNTAAATLSWLDEHVAGKPPKDPKEPPVKVFITGAEEWRSLETWPPPTKQRVMFLLSGGLLRWEDSFPGKSDRSSTFLYDPADPTPTVGGPSLYGGKVDNTLLAARKDVLCFTTHALEEDVEVLGEPVVELEHRSDNNHADLFARLCEVDAAGRSWNITEAFERFDDRDQGVKVMLVMVDCGHRFKKGCKIQLLVAGGSFPMYTRNLGTGENPCTGKTMKTATHAVCHGEGGVSRLLLPVSV